MTTELVLLLGIFAFILLGVFMGDRGPVGVFRKSTPRLAAKIERNISLSGRNFNVGEGRAPQWEEPPR